jgi:hypothetical protein
VFGQAFRPGLAVPLLKRLRCDFALNEQLSEFPALRLTLEGHDILRAARMVRGLFFIAVSESLVEREPDNGLLH